MSPFHANSSGNHDLKWDAFIESMHRVWEYAPDFTPIGPLSLTRRKVLVVDVDTAHNDQLDERLTRIGTSMTMVESFERAFDELSEQSIDLVILGADLVDEDACEWLPLTCGVS